MTTALEAFRNIASVGHPSAGKTTLVETPGYPDFTADVHAALFAVDLVVGVVSASGPVTYNLRKKLEAASSLGRGRLIVVTHVDGDNSDFDETVAELTDKVGAVCVPMLVPDRSGRGFSGVTSVVSDEQSEWRKRLMDHEMTINGLKAGDDLLSPGWTAYNQTILYDTKEVTSLLRAGRNVIGLTLGNGMYNVVRRNRFVKFTGSFGALRAILHLRLEYADGSTQILGTDETWRTCAGPITFSNIYGGEDYDARLNPTGWDLPGFVDRAWPTAVQIIRPSGKLRGRSIFCRLRWNWSPRNYAKMLLGLLTRSHSRWRTNAIISRRLVGDIAQRVECKPRSTPVTII